MKIKVALIVASVLIITIIAFCIYYAHSRAQNLKELELLFTSREVNLVALHITGQGKSIDVTDDEILNYLNQAFHLGNSGDKGGGITYDVRLEFKSGRSVQTWIYVYDSLDGFSVGIPSRIHAGDPENWGVHFPQPIPAKVSQLFKTLSK